MSSPTTNLISDAADSFEQRLASASAAMGLGDHAACAETAERLYMDAQASGDAAMVAEAALLLAKDYSNAQDLTRCMHWAELSLQAAQACQAPHLQAVAWVVMSSTHASLEQPVKAVAGIQQALALLNHRMTAQAQRSVFTGIGISYNALGMPLQALSMFQKSSAVSQDAGDPSLRARVRGNVVFAMLASYDLLETLDAPRAERLLRDAQCECDLLKVDARLAGHSHAWAWYCQAAGMVSYRLGDFAQARSLFEAALQAEALLPAALQRGLLVRLGQVLLAQGDPEQALICAQQASALRTSEDNTLGLAEDLLQASELAELMGDPSGALALYRRYHARVVRNEHAAFDARVADLSATVAAQSMRLEISDLQARNAGLSSTFQQLNDLALTDALTAASNRRGLEQAFTRLRANGQTVVLAMMDLDHFKEVNDRFSHGVGDQVLREAGRLMAESLRDRDKLGRYGGEEFTAFVVDTALPDALVIAERLRERVQVFDWFDIADGLAVTISIGVVRVRSHESFAQAVARADVLLYAAKAQGRNRVLAEGVDGVEGLEGLPTDGV
jgi:diguanylate cyclase (GGDEF)-like protein